MKSSTARTISKPATTRGTNAAASDRMSPEPSPPKTSSAGPRRSGVAPARQSPTRNRTGGSRRASPQRRSTGVSPPPDGSSQARSPTSATRRQAASPTTSVKGFNSQAKKQILSHEFLTKTTSKARGGGPSLLTRSIDEPRRPGKPQDFLSKSHDHGSLASYRAPKAVAKSYGPMSLSKSQDRGLMSKSQDRGSLVGATRRTTTATYGFDGRRLSTGSREVTSHAHRISDIKAHYQGPLQMGRSVDSTVSLSTAASSQRRSFSRRSPSRGYRSGEGTPEEASPLDGRAPRQHRQLKSPDFFDVKKVDGDVGGVITAVSRMHHKVRESAARKEDTDSAHFNYKLEKELIGAQELLEIGSWNEDDEEYLRVERSAEGSFVDILEDTASGKMGKPAKWAEVGQFVGQDENALDEKSEPTTSTQPSPDRAAHVSSTSATSIDLNRSSDTTCSTHSQYDNAFWADAPAVDAPWKRSTASIAPRASRYDDGLERLSSYMKTASKKRGVSDDLSSSQASGCFDYLVDFLESQQSIADVLVSAHDQVLVAAGNVTPKRLDAASDTPMLSSRSIESRVTDLGSEASWESGKSRSVQTLGTTGKVMDQITEKVDSLSFDSPKHLSTFKFGLKKTTVGAFETITSSDQLAASSRHPSRSFSGNPDFESRASPCPDPVPEARLPPFPHHRLPSPLSTSARQIKIVSEASVESTREDELASPPGKAPVTQSARRQTSKTTNSVETNIDVEAPLKDVQMHPRRNGSSGEEDEEEVVFPKPGSSVRLVKSASMKVASSLVKHDPHSLSLRLNQSNKGCGCTIL